MSIHSANTPASGGDICDFRPDLGASTPEPSVRDILRSYYGCGLEDPKDALSFTNAYCDALAAIAAQPPQADDGVVPETDYRCTGGHDLCHGGTSAGPDCLYCEAAPPLNTGSAVGGETPGSKIIAGMKDAVAFAQGDTSRGRIVHPAPAEAGDDLAALSARAIYFFRQFRQCTFGEDHGTPAVIYNDPSSRPGCWVDTESMALLEAFTAARLTPASRPAEQGEPVAWAWEMRGTDGSAWLPFVGPKKPLPANWRRNIVPLFAHPAPAASRPAVGREELADTIAAAVMSMRWALDASDKWGCAFRKERDERRAEVREVVLALLEPRDDTRAGGADAQEGGR